MAVKPDGALRLDFALAPQARILEVSVEGEQASFTFEEGKLRIPVPRAMRHNEIELTVSYESVFDDAPPEDPVNADDPSYGVTGVVSSQGIFLLSGAGWYPVLPESSPTFCLQVHAPAGIEAVTAGKRLKRETRDGVATSMWEVTHPLPGLALSAGHYIVREKDACGTPVYTYFSPANDTLAGEYLEATAGYIRLYSELIGPYPFDKFAVVENFFPTGYGFPSYTLLGSTVIRLPFILETSLGHEVAHSWWGNSVLADSEQGNWSEGLTAYVAEHLYKERLSAAEAREYRLKLLRDYAALVRSGKDFPLTEFTQRFSPASQAVGYGKGAMVFHMARRRVGDKAFWEGLQDIFHEKAFQTVSWDDFAGTLGRRGGQDLTGFFRQWVMSPGAPLLSIDEVRARQEASGWRITGRLIQQEPFYELNVPLRLETDGQRIATVVSLTDAMALFTLHSKSPPRRLVVDPEVDVFRRLDPVEIPPTINRIRGSSSLIVVVARSLPPPVLEASRVILKALGQERSPVLREKETPFPILKGHDVLYLGIPQKKGFLSPLPEGLIMSPDSFALEGTTYDTPDDALFIVVSHPEDDQNVAAVFLPLSAGAASTAARKIPHYGRFSYLAFRKGSHRAKGIWPVVTSPLIHTFTPEEASP